MTQPDPLHRLPASPDGRSAGAAGLRRDITFALAAKFVALVALYLLFFSPAHRHPADLAARIAGDAVPLALLPSR